MIKSHFNQHVKGLSHRLGRPRKPRGQKRVKPLRLFLTEHEETILVEKADLAGMSKHDFTRSLICGHEPKTTGSLRADPRELLALNSIGNLLNQIARQLNSGHPTKVHVVEVLNQLKVHLTQKALQR